MIGKFSTKSKPWCTCIPGKLDGWSARGKVFWVHSCGKPSRMFLKRKLEPANTLTRIKVCTVFLYGNRELSSQEDEHVFNSIEELFKF